MVGALGATFTERFTFELADSSLALAARLGAVLVSGVDESSRDSTPLCLLVFSHTRI